MNNYEEIKNYLLNHVDEIGDIITEINSIDNSLDYLEYWNNDEDFNNWRREDGQLLLRRVESRARSGNLRHRGRTPAVYIQCLEIYNHGRNQRVST